MIKGIGTDLVSIKRIEDVYLRHGNRFVNKILGGQELQDFVESKHKVNFLAKRFAVKEAVVKAFGLGFTEGMRWQDIQLAHHASGQPRVQLQNKALNYYTSLCAQSIHISLSDEKDMVCAFVVIE